MSSMIYPIDASAQNMYAEFYQLYRQLPSRRRWKPLWRARRPSIFSLWERIEALPTTERSVYVVAFYHIFASIVATSPDMMDVLTAFRMYDVSRDRSTWTTSVLFRHMLETFFPFPRSRTTRAGRVVQQLASAPLHPSETHDPILQAALTVYEQLADWCCQHSSLLDRAYRSAETDDGMTTFDPCHAIAHLPCYDQSILLHWMVYQCRCHRLWWWLSCFHASVRQHVLTVAFQELLHHRSPWKTTTTALQRLNRNLYDLYRHQNEETYGQTYHVTKRMQRKMVDYIRHLPALTAQDYQRQKQRGLSHTPLHALDIRIDELFSIPETTTRWHVLRDVILPRQRAYAKGKQQRFQAGLDSQYFSTTPTTS